MHAGLSFTNKCHTLIMIKTGVHSIAPYTYPYSINHFKCVCGRVGKIISRVITRSIMSHAIGSLSRKQHFQLFHPLDHFNECFQVEAISLVLVVPKQLRESAVKQKKYGIYNYEYLLIVISKFCVQCIHILVQK